MKKHCTPNHREILIGIAIITAFTMVCFPAYSELGYVGMGSGAGQGSKPQNRQPAATEFDGQTIEKYAALQVKLEEIYYDFAEKLQGARDQKKAAALQREKSDTMAKAVRNEGLNIDTYNAITSQILLDEQLRRKVRLEQIRLQAKSQ